MRVTQSFLRGILFAAIVFFSLLHAFPDGMLEIAEMFILPFWFMFAAIVYWWEVRMIKWGRKRSGRDRRKGV